MIYIPGVVRVCLAIANNRDDARRLPIKRNSIAAITDGSAVLGLGNLGPEIDPAEAIRYATVVATGRSDFPNQITDHGLPGAEAMFGPTKEWQRTHTVGGPLLPRCRPRSVPGWHRLVATVVGGPIPMQSHGDRPSGITTGHARFV